ncbi:MAG: hypothetical protein D6717_11865 [Gammaproteobacteria bacterium]|nr:MAG: hypothetical protein D6717_11865 [Gammaproteobacteria bacterium]
MNGQSTLADLVIAFFDLVEAEGRELRRQIGRAGVGLGLVAVAALLLLAALITAGWAVYAWLQPLLGAPLAALSVSLLLLVSAGLMLWLAVRRLQ